MGDLNLVAGKDYDFAGWVTKYDTRCKDGLIIRHGAFSKQNGKKVPLCWNHGHKEVAQTLGHVILEARDEGFYGYGSFNNTSSGKDAKECLIHGDIDCMSVWADTLSRTGSDVFDGIVREVSLVHAGANPGAFIESVFAHGISMEEDDTEAVIYSGDTITIASEIVEHSAVKDDEKKDPEDASEYPAPKKDDKTDDSDDKKETDDKEESKSEEKADDKSEDSGDDKETIGDVVDTMSDKQKKAVAILIAQAAKDAETNNKEEKVMKHNIFEVSNEHNGNVIAHSAFASIMADAKKCGSLKEAVNAAMEEGGVLAHSIDTTGMEGPSASTASQTYGFRDPDMLFPEYKSLNNQPEWISRNMDWVNVVLQGVHRTPFSRIKSQYADITEDAARAKGYMKGNLKKEEVFTLLKRTTDPQTIYKKQKMDRDDIIDITDFDVIAWIKAEMRVMLNEEIARAILIGDGRLADDDDKIQEQHVRPIVSDVPLFNIKVPVTESSKTPGSDEYLAENAKNTINAVIRGRKQYRGSGNPVFFTTEDVLTEMLLMEDTMGHKLYKSEAEVATALRVSKIVTVEAMENQTITVSNKVYPLIGVIVNLSDYNVGADKGGNIEFFDDFDIDYNQFKYLLETRISGALVKPFSAMTVYLNAEVNPI